MSRPIVAAWLALCLIVLTGAPVPAQESSAEEQDERIPGVEIFEIESFNHSLDPVDYEILPPAGGEHHPVWQNCGFYEEPVIPEHAVHSQEHGAVWITYDPELNSDQLASLEQLARENQYLLVTPFLDLPAPVVASAWGAQLRLDSVVDPGCRSSFASTPATDRSVAPPAVAARTRRSPYRRPLRRALRPPRRPRVRDSSGRFSPRRSCPAPDAARS